MGKVPGSLCLDRVLASAMNHGSEIRIEFPSYRKNTSLQGTVEGFDQYFIVVLIGNKKMVVNKAHVLTIQEA